MGLREQKKEQTRRRIAEVAWRMFAEHGFDRVTVTRIAWQAKVAPATVFNYFPAKEDLFYGPLEAFGQRLVDAVDAREPGESVLTAFERFLLGANEALEAVERGDAEALRQLTTLSQVIVDSPALLARERQALDRHAAELARRLTRADADASETVVAQAVANAVLGVHHALIAWVRQRVLAGDTERLATQVREATRAAVARLASGLGDYGSEPNPTDG